MQVFPFVLRIFKMEKEIQQKLLEILAKNFLLSIYQNRAVKPRPLGRGYKALHFVL